MSPVSKNDQEELNKQYQNLNGKERAELLLSSIIGRKLTNDELEMIKTGVTEYIAWHEKQHPSFDKCDDCEFVRQNIIMFKTMEFWHSHFQSMINSNK